MSTIGTKEGTEIYYKDWGSGQPLVFDAFWRQGMQGGLKDELDCIRAFSEMEEDV